jgi:hypothetical protein
MKQPNSFQPNRRWQQEEAAWMDLYKNVEDLTVAEQIVELLESDPAARNEHLALYLQAKGTLKRCNAARTRNQRVGAAVRAAFWLVFVKPFKLLGKARSAVADMAVEMLPQPPRTVEPTLAPAKSKRATTARRKPVAKRAEPAQVQVAALQQDGELGKKLTNAPAELAPAESAGAGQAANGATVPNVKSA